ncbi:NAD(P)-dependent oxidoreductase [Aureimonas sp. AU20]|uniref:NAD(P)-dependent oxidoreductase n=1 Tax=Aureimonas sp. AU20 TaxID=1349819 RepID=UPI00071EF049|nr:NAD(P)-dependent oxidoreductase [Aureimonas sp. AU20]ALN74546.1 hypothetical protein M673_17665 [Aureimonas sp. AU20]
MPDPVSTGPIAVLGTGIIGAAVARNLARKGFSVRAWNRSADKAKALEPDGVMPFEDVTEAVRGAAMVLTVLKDGPAVLEAMEAARPALGKGSIWLQLSTVGIEATDRLAAFAGEAGLVFYDAPVLGTRQPAEQGKLVILGSGPVEGREHAQPVFDAIGQRTIWVGEAAGASSRLKLALNSYVFVLTHGTAETLRIAEALGVDPRLVLEALTGGQLDSGYLQGKGGAMLSGDWTTSFSLDNGIKDARLIVEALAGTGVRADLAEAGLARFERASEAGHGDKDIAASFLA